MTTWKPFSKHYLRSLASRLKNQGWYVDICDFDWEEDFNKDTYLIKYSHPSDGGRNQPLALMGDFGITWEPARAYQTEKLASIAGKNPDKDADTMIKTGLKYILGDGEKIKKVSTYVIIPAYGP